MTTEEKIRKQLADYPIILYMKGVPDKPECGFSAKAVNLLNETNIPYHYVNVLAAPFIREKLPNISHWPTYPQLFVNGELVGGCDIMEAMAKEGGLIPLLNTAASSQAEPDALTTTQVGQLVKSGFADAKVLIEGEGCDLVVTVISDEFAGLPLVKKQQKVMATLTAPLASGTLHAVSVKAYTASEWQEKSANSATGLLQIQI